jgi:Na+-translocating ferredoxin:NAD+ oxidoreductase RnfE subunit
MADFSLAILSAISVDRLLALSLGIRYRQIVTMKRARLFVALFLLFSIGNCVTQLVNAFAFLVYNALMCFLYLMDTIRCIFKITKRREKRK